MADLSDAQYKSLLVSELIRKRADQTARKTIEQYSGLLVFQPLENLMISHEAWEYITALGIDPKIVFAHPDLLHAHPETSQYYRGMALLSQKQVRQLAGVGIAAWESETRRLPVRRNACVGVAQLYNAILSSIIEDSTAWTLENGYRNILASMGIRLDGMVRNKIGQMAEEIIKTRIATWLREHDLIVSTLGDGVYELPLSTTMRYGSEPDIKIERAGQSIATIEIKGGKDPAGALERLGAMQKSFAETPPGCVNFLIAGVITSEMKARLDQIGVVKVYLLNSLTHDGTQWDSFTEELFHHIVRIM